MKGKKLFVLAATMGLLVATLTYVYIRRLEAQAPVEIQHVPVVLAAVDIPAGTVIKADMLRQGQVVVSALHPDASRSIREVTGRIAREPIIRGEQVLHSRLLPAGVRPSLTFQIPPGKRAITVAVNEVIGVAGFVKPGDRVDVLATFEDGTEKEAVTTTVLQDIEILAIAQDMEKEVDKKPRVTTTVTLAVTLAQAQKITLAEETGTLRLVLRPVSTVNKEWTRPVATTDLLQGAIPASTKEPPPRSGSSQSTPSSQQRSGSRVAVKTRKQKERIVEVIRGIEREFVRVKAD